MRFLIAGKPITLAKNHVNQSMTMEQLLEAEPRCCRVDQKGGYAPGIFRSGRARLLAKSAEISRLKFLEDPFNLATVAARLGETDATFVNLEKAYQQRSVELLYWLQTEPAFDRFRSDSRFQTFVRRIGLTQ
jgi:hypothetical protein